MRALGLRVSLCRVCGQGRESMHLQLDWWAWSLLACSSSVQLTPTCRLVGNFPLQVHTVPTKVTHRGTIRGEHTPAAVAGACWQFSANTLPMPRLVLPRRTSPAHLPRY